MAEDKNSLNGLGDSSGTGGDYDFTQSNPPLSDVILLVDGQRLHVSKTYLALHSPVFHAMFYSDFSEHSKAEVELKEVGVHEFVELLRVIYPSRKPVSAKSVEFLLKLADRFHIKNVTAKCENFLQYQAGEISLAKTFLLAEEFDLHRLQEWCMGQLGRIEDVLDLVKTEEYEQLGNKRKVAVLERAAHFQAGTYGICRKCEHVEYSCKKIISCKCCSSYTGGYINVSELMEMKEYSQFCDEIKLALLKQAFKY